MYLVVLATVYFVFCSKHWWFVVGIPVHRHLDFSFLWSAKSVSVSLLACHFPKLIDLSSMLLYSFLFFLVSFYSMIILLPLHQVLDQQEKWACMFNPEIILNSLIPKTCFYTFSFSGEIKMRVIGIKPEKILLLTGFRQAFPTPNHQICILKILY